MSNAAVPGPVLFVRYASPPNQRGSCGPPESGQFFEYGVNGTVDPGLQQLARQFAGAWPYLELIATTTGIADPLDRRVVEAYWIGNPLLDRVGVRALGDSVEQRFRRRTGQFDPLADSVLAGGMPHHSYHVLCVYPWLGLLGSGGNAGRHALTVLDRCRIRWGRVRSVDGDQAVVESSPLNWDGKRLDLAPAEPEVATAAVDGAGFVTDLQPGDWVALHWDWICDRLDQRQLKALRRYTAHHLDIANHRLGNPWLAKHLG